MKSPFLTLLGLCLCVSLFARCTTEANLQKIVNILEGPTFGFPASPQFGIISINQRTQNAFAKFDWNTAIAGSSIPIRITSPGSTRPRIRLPIA